MYNVTEYTLKSCNFSKKFKWDLPLGPVQLCGGATRGAPRQRRRLIYYAYRPSIREDEISILIVLDKRETLSEYYIAARRASIAARCGRDRARSMLSRTSFTSNALCALRAASLPEY